MQVARRCPYLDKHENIDDNEDSNASPLGKYGFKSKNKRKKRKVIKTDSHTILQVGSFFIQDACPVSLLKEERWLTNYISLINWSEDMKTPLIDGGLNNYTNWFYEVRNTVISEQRKVEREMMEKSKKENSKSKPKASRKVGK